MKFFQEPVQNASDRTWGPTNIYDLYSAHCYFYKHFNISFDYDILDYAA